MPDADTATAPAKPKPAPPEGHVRVRVMKKGDDKIFTGQTIPDSKTNPFPRYAKGDEFTMPLEGAVKFEEVDGWVEIIS